MVSIAYPLSNPKSHISFNQTIHPALTVTNITNFIKIILDIEKSQYNTWSELFKIHAQAYEVLDHIIPPAETDTTSSSPSLKETNPALWKRLDAIVLQWIYGTISTDLLHTIIELYPLTPRPSNQSTTPSTFVALSNNLWHNRLGHPGASILNSLHRNNFIVCNKFQNNFVCQSCQFGKQIKLPFYESLSHTLLPFDIVHSDLWTSPTLSSGGHRYYILFLDDFTNFLWTFPIANKSQTYSVFLKFRNHIKTQFERDIKCFQCDNGKEYDNTSFHKFCEQNGMSFRFSCPHTSPQNGKAERKIRTINNMIRTLLAHASLPPSFWHHALQMATYLLNILPNKKLALQTPTTILYQKLPSYSHLKVFGCLCFPLIPSTTRNKLQPRSKPCVFLGYPSNHRGYKCLDLSSHKIFISRHVIFDEKILSLSLPHMLLSLHAMNF
jgi:transposase InsO family protein